MDKFISKEWLKNAINDRISVNNHPDPILSMMQKHESQEVLRLIESAPEADISQRNAGKSGFWTYNGVIGDLTHWKCSICGQEIVLKYIFIPERVVPRCSCGARMEGRNNNAT